MTNLDAIKSALTCIVVAEKLGIDVPHKRDAVCPRHKGASLRIKDDWWRCFGGCEAGGDVFDLHQFITGGDFRAAVVELAGWAGVQIEWSEDEQRKADERRRVEDVLAYAAAFYQMHFGGSVAESYANGRGWKDVAESARLGYAPDTWDGLAHSMREAKIDLGLGIAAGLIQQRHDGKYYDLFRHRLVIPFIDRGRVVYLQARALGKGETTEGEPKYLNTAHDSPPLYHLNGALQARTPILTESTSDVLSFTAHAHLPAIGTVGSQVKPQHLARLERLQHIYVATHNDKAGMEFADKLALALGERLRIVPPPQGYKDWDEAFHAAQRWEADETLTWLRWRVRQMDAGTDAVALRRGITPILDYLARLNDPALVATYLVDLRTHFRWTREIAKGYEQDIKARRTTHQRETSETQQVKHDDSGAQIDLMPDVNFMNPAQAYYDGIVYVARQATRKETIQGKFGTRTVEVNRPVVVTSERRILPMPKLRKDDPPGTVLYLDRDKRLALYGPVQQAAHTWSYESMSAHVRGDAPAIIPHAVYDSVDGLFRKHLYHRNDDDYVIDVLWCIGTYFHQIFDAYPYLNIHGQKGSGKTTVLVLLGHLAFNGYHVTNVSEASLFRWIEAAAPTMLIDEQEGLTSRQAAREQKADLMGILKSGYQKGPVVTRQDTNDPSIMRQYHIYCPKAIASVELFEDILADRSLLTYMHRPPDELFKNGRLTPRNQMRHEDFAPVRDSLYLLLMQHAAAVAGIAPQVRMTYAGRFGELALPLFTIAALVDHSRGEGPQIITKLARALEIQQQRRIERNDTTPEQMFKAAVELASTDAQDADKPRPAQHAQRLSDGSVIMDALHIADSFRRLFPSAKESYFRMEWLGKQVQKAEFIEPWSPYPREDEASLYRWRRTVQERDELTGEIQPTEKMLTVYCARFV